MAKDTCLFSKKELYVMEHTYKGKSRRIDGIPERHRRKMIYENMHLMEGMTFTNRNHFPHI